MTTGPKMTFTPTHPRHFWNEYVLPSYERWQQNQSSPDLAAHAIAQMDIMAEIALIYIKGRCLRPREAGKFRGRLARVRPGIGRVSELHDAHKHGELKRATEFVPAARPSAVTNRKYFTGNPLGHLTTYARLGVNKAAGGHESVAELLFAARKAWEEIFLKHGW